MEDLNQDNGQPIQDPSNEGNSSESDNAQGNDDASSDSTGSQKDNSGQGQQGQSDNDDDNQEVPVRKSNLQFILERQQKKLQKLKSQQQQSQADNRQTPPPVNDDDADDQDDNLSPQEEARLNKIIDKRFGKKLELVDQLAEKREQDDVSAEITDFFKNDPYADLVKKHEAKIRKYALHPSRAQVPIQDLIYGIAGKELIAYGAELARKAMKEARNSQNGGHSARKPEGQGSKDAMEMSQADFQADLNARLQRG